LTKPIVPSQVEPLFHVTFVCMGNICRSPTAHGVFRHKVQQAGLAPQLHVDSAGTTATTPASRRTRAARPTPAHAATSWGTCAPAAWARLTSNRPTCCW
jgi:hypothetical protein